MLLPELTYNEIGGKQRDGHRRVRGRGPWRTAVKAAPLAIGTDEKTECHPAAQSLFGKHIRDGAKGCMAVRLETTASKGAARDCPALPDRRQNILVHERRTNERAN
eukprot:6042394-Amphidinium_carterae.1